MASNPVLEIHIHCDENRVKDSNFIHGLLFSSCSTVLFILHVPCVNVVYFDHLHPHLKSFPLG